MFASIHELDRVEVCILPVALAVDTCICGMKVIEIVLDPSRFVIMSLVLYMCLFVLHVQLMTFSWKKEYGSLVLYLPLGLWWRILATITGVVQVGVFTALCLDRQAIRVQSDIGVIVLVLEGMALAVHVLFPAFLFLGPHRYKDLSKTCGDLLFKAEEHVIEEMNMPLVGF